MSGPRQEYDANADFEDWLPTAVWHDERQIRAQQNILRKVRGQPPLPEPESSSDDDEEEVPSIEARRALVRARPIDYDLVSPTQGVSPSPRQVTFGDGRQVNFSVPLAPRKKKWKKRR